MVGEEETKEKEVNIVKSVFYRYVLGMNERPEKWEFRRAIITGFLVFLLVFISFQIREMNAGIQNYKEKIFNATIFCETFYHPNGTLILPPVKIDDEKLFVPDVKIRVPS